MKTWEFACTILEQFGHVALILGVCNLVPTLKICVFVEEKFEFFVNHDEWLQQSRNSIMRLMVMVMVLWCSDVMVSRPSAMDPTRIVYLDPTREFTASCAPELHWQLTITYRGSLPKIIFQNSLWFVAFVSV